MTTRRFDIEMPGVKFGDVRVQVMSSKRRRIEVDVDRISMLPDELLVCILSLLSFKEVCGASIVCRRWRYLHTLTSKLDFDGTASLWNMNPVVIREKERNYIESVGRAVGSHQTTRLSEFRVAFFTLTKSHTQPLDEWVEFALSRKVESLDLHLCQHGGVIPEDWRYAFPCKYLKLGDSNHLKKLSMNYVNVSGEAVEMILANCPALEQLSIAQSTDLVALEISKPFPSFRMLEILMCWNLKSVMVRDSNITTLKYNGEPAKFVLENVGQLREICVGGLCTRSMEDVVEMFSTKLLQHLPIFKLHFCYTALGISQLCPIFRGAVSMTSLKEFVVHIPILKYDANYLLPFIHLVKASPNLQRFVILVPHDKYHLMNMNMNMNVMIPRVKRESPRAYPCLKEVEVVGYYGLSSQVEILRHFMENAIALQSITIDLWGFNRDLGYFWDRLRPREFNPNVVARANALKQCAPFGINVNIL